MIQFYRALHQDIVYIPIGLMLKTKFMPISSAFTNDTLKLKTNVINIHLLQMIHQYQSQYIAVSMRLVLPFLLFVFMLFGCSSKQSGLYSKKGIVKCADYVEHKVCWIEHIKTWR